MGKDDDIEKTEDRDSPSITWAERTDVGRTRAENQDAMGQGDFGEFRLWVVCDGMGGHAGGSTASRLAVHTFLEHFGSSENEDPRERLDAALREANDRVFAEASSIKSLRGMGTTAVCVLINTESKEAFIAHVGDSRGYMARNDQYKRVTLDHTMVQFMVDDGLLSVQEAAEHPHGNIIARSIGSKSLKVEHQEPLALEEGDLFLMCSDGLSGRVTDDEMAEIVWDNEPETACNVLVDLANERGGEDNITVQIIVFGERGERPESIEIVHPTERPPALHPEEQTEKKGEALDFKRIQKVIEARNHEIKNQRGKAGWRSLRNRMSGRGDTTDSGDRAATPADERRSSKEEPLPESTDLVDGGDESGSTSGAKARVEANDPTAAMPAVLLGVALGLIAFLVVYFVVTTG